MNRSACMCTNNRTMNQMRGGYPQMNRTAQETCACGMLPEVPAAGNRRQLLRYLNEVSFCAYDAMLYLDTHPEDTEAMQYFRECSKKREQALAAYAELYGPLSFAQAASCETGSMQWVSQPWPWEGGDC